MSIELFVGNLNPECRTRDLENVFGRYGRIVRCDLKKNFGFIQFEEKEDAEEAIRKEDNRRLLGSEMTVEWAKGSIGDPQGKKGRSDFGKRGYGDRNRDRSPMGRNNYDSRGAGGRDRYQGGGRRDSYNSGPSRYESRGYSDRPPRGDRPPRDRRDDFSRRDDFRSSRRY